MKSRRADFQDDGQSSAGSPARGRRDEDPGRSSGFGPAAPSRKRPANRDNAIYIAFLAAACVIGYAVSLATSDSGESAAPVDLVFPEASELEIEVPLEFPYARIEFKSRRAPRLAFSDNLERVLVEVRSALLASAAPVEVRRSEELAAAVD